MLLLERRQVQWEQCHRDVLANTKMVQWIILLPLRLVPLGKKYKWQSWSRRITDVAASCSWLLGCSSKSETITAARKDRASVRTI